MKWANIIFYLTITFSVFANDELYKGPKLQLEDQQGQKTQMIEPKIDDFSAYKLGSDDEQKRSISSQDERTDDSRPKIWKYDEKSDDEIN